jgi:acetolactate decarboxylase
MRSVLAGFAFFSLLAGLPVLAAERDTLYQVSAIDGLMVGLYDGVTTIGELRTHGDFGIGTFHGLDGEMLVLDGTVFQIPADGKVRQVADSATTPFASVSFFESEQILQLAGLDQAGLTRALDQRIGTDNIPYAVRMEGQFKRVRTRSVPRQTPPYAPLAEVAKKQSVFEFETVRGVMVGYRLPSLMGRINVPGYHLHFITDDHTAGGHVLDFEVAAVTVALDALPHFRMVLPTTEAFRAADLRRDRAAELKKVEQ